MENREDNSKCIKDRGVSLLPVNEGRFSVIRTAFSQKYPQLTRRKVTDRAVLCFYNELAILHAKISQQTLKNEAQWGVKTNINCSRLTSLTHEKHDKNHEADIIFYHVLPILYTNF